MDKSKIKNFSIIAHIDHGKSTLADRILEITNTVPNRELTDQFLDSMELEKERGITIKLNAVQIKYKDYVFHLIDTPGHVDFTYEVSRSLAASEGALLIVDATQGIEAQTLANVYLAFENNLKIIPVINKIDLPSANVEEVKKEIEDVIGIPTDNAVLVSAKTGFGVDNLLDAIIKYIPSPIDADDNKPLKALIFDSYFDPYRGVVMLVRIFEGQLKTGDKFKFMSRNDERNFYHVIDLGVRNPYETKKDSLQAGEVGWVSAAIRDAKEVNVGDTITLIENPTPIALPGYKKMKPVVFTGFYPVDTRDYAQLKESLEKISLSDSSITWEQETSKALGFGFRVGFLGLLHMEILQERLDREYKVGIIATSPSVEYKVYLTNNEIQMIANPTLLPDRTYIEKIEEPYVEAHIFIPNEYIGNVMELCQNKRGIYKSLEMIDSKRSSVVYELPLAETIFDFFDRLKSSTKGYASFEYEWIGYRESDLVKVDILLNGDKVDAFSMITHRDRAYENARELCVKLKDAIPRQNFEVPVQATIGGKIIARETIKAYRKDVTAKLYGGDVTRRQKLLKKQKEGKKRMKKLGSIEVPQEAFLSILKTNIDQKK
ncbi:translation elongation factor 4 [Mycoplasmopsis cynos]|uniref:Elongation factor 4 n=1 Tax=Mycoplasmopsis cynos (strain C142) TaxID=1246955 RepID=L0RV15_MYCC1|nr:translation elongation factor 4 [Mycoplasmopsis cynos]WQQ13008.1 translation elongation factor 4 [Mycoplasmopsis cynos]WQQ14110.1 translation elongation factor 4 [Mycoplasmopsis cynos]WQQ16090.1 translation elongation factor 4 [Mycoplasmopsis cynos]WQQ16870.1 translation elongation factor 4 [Mycoplasmopsis cynos]WQQ18502.1 translation elongation factor 4 [Mycoplasmopsis cynos]